MSESAGGDGSLDGRGPQPSGWGRVQTYMLIIPGSVAPLNLRALKGSQGRHHITRGNKIPGRLGPGFASLLSKLFVSGTPGQCTQ